MPSLDEYANHSPYSDPGRRAELLDALPTDLRGLTDLVRNVLVHYRAAGITFTGARLDEIDSRWIARILDVDQSRHDMLLAAPRVESERVAGCCRDFSLLTVAALRQQGIPARCRIGFAGYFVPGFHFDHVVAEHWDGARWVYTDAQLDPGAFPFDPADIPRLVGAAPPAPPTFESAARVWTRYRRGDLNLGAYGVDPGMPIGGGGFLRNYVIFELAHRQRDELLLWDSWGAVGGDIFHDSEVDLRHADLIDEIAALLLAADDGDESAEGELTKRYAADSRVRPGSEITCHSPSGSQQNVTLAG